MKYYNHTFIYFSGNKEEKMLNYDIGIAVSNLRYS
jgi:hypothetical protein